jgi:hypothetical protein
MAESQESPDFRRRTLTIVHMATDAQRQHCHGAFQGKLQNTHQQQGFFQKRLSSSIMYKNELENKAEKRIRSIHGPKTSISLQTVAAVSVAARSQSKLL